MHRRDFLRATALAAGALTASPLLTHAADVPSPAPHIRALPFLSVLSLDSIALTWPVNGLCTGHVEYGPTPALGKIAEGSADGLRPIDAAVLTIRISNLSPGEHIHFRTVTIPVDFPSHYAIKRGDPIASPVFEYTHLAPANTTRIAVWNDTHQQPATLEALARATTAFTPDLLVLNGDLVHDQFNTPNDLPETLFNLHSAASADIPHLVVRGNHDARGRHARELPRYAPRPSFDGYHALLRLGPIGIITLDTGDDKERPDVYGGLGDFAAYREQQKHWLATALTHPAFASAPYRIVFCHIPLAWKNPKRTGDWCPDGDARWSSLLAEAKVHAIISGHTHEQWHDTPKPGRPWHQIISGGPELKSTKWSPTPACLVTLEATATALQIRTTELLTNTQHLALTLRPDI